jgi:hypothetical protein
MSQDKFLEQRVTGEGHFIKVTNTNGPVGGSDALCH